MKKIKGRNSHGVKHYSVQCPYSGGGTSFHIHLRNTREHAALRALISAGATGCNFFSDPAPRWASAIHRLRQRGLDILTLREAHGGPYPGYHAVYVLRSVITPIPSVVGPSGDNHGA